MAHLTTVAMGRDGEIRPDCYSIRPIVIAPAAIALVAELLACGQMELLGARGLR